MGGYGSQSVALSGRSRVVSSPGTCMTWQFCARRASGGTAVLPLPDSSTPRRLQQIRDRLRLVCLLISVAVRLGPTCGLLSLPSRPGRSAPGHRGNRDDADNQPPMRHHRLVAPAGRLSAGSIEGAGPLADHSASRRLDTADWWEPGPSDVQTRCGRVPVPVDRLAPTRDCADQHASIPKRCDGR